MCDCRPADDAAGDSDDDGALLKVKRVDHAIGPDPAVEQELRRREERRAARKITKAAAAHRLLKKSILPNTKMTFNDEGEVGPVLLIGGLLSTRRGRSVTLLTGRGRPVYADR